jgi:hypothetical protein
MPRLLEATALALLILAVPVSPARAWGGDGHKTIGAVADIILQQHPVTQAKVSQILGGASLSEASEWMDCAKGFNYCHRKPSDEEKTYVDKNPDHHTYHYTDVPIQQPEYKAGTAGTKNDDAVQVLRYAIQVLRGNVPNAGPINLNQKEALWVIAHLAGDIHQPLHVAAAYYDQDCANVVDPNVVGTGQPNFGIGITVASTTGGNDFQISSTRNLHAYWDSSTVTGAMRLVGVRNNSVQDFAQFVVNNPPAGWKTMGDVDTWPEQWATEVLPLAKQAIIDADIGDPTSHDEDTHGIKCTWPATIDREYTKWANQAALTQLGKAGFRLAALLQAIFEGN